MLVNWFEFNVCFGEQYGGSERYVSNLVKYHAKDHEVHIFSTTKHLSQRGVVKTEDYTLHRFYAPITIWNINPVSYILSKLKNFEADLFHVHSYLYFLSNQALIAKYLSKVPTILHLHGGIGLPPYETSLIQKISKIFYDHVVGKLMVKGADVVASVSKFDIIKAKELFGSNSARFVYMPNGVDTEQFTPDKSKSWDSNTNILYVGDMEPWKGVDFLLNTIKKHDGLADGTIFHFIGQGSLSSQIVQFNKKNGYQVNYLGEKSHSSIPEYMQKADMFVFPSKWEGTPTVVLEAMSSGLPVISTPVGDVPIIIRHKQNGIICHREEKQLIGHIRTLQQDPHLKNTISKNARAYVERNYDFARIADLVEQKYYELVA